MKKYTTILLILIFSFQLVNSQETILTLTLSPETSWTKDTMTFFCKIQNHSNKTFKIIPLSHDCSTKYYPLFWKIRILKDNLTFDYDPEESIVVLVTPRHSELDRIAPHSEHYFSFCINFNKLTLIGLSESGPNQINSLSDRKRINAKDSINKHFGEYKIQLDYLSTLRIKKQPDKLISNVTTVIYQDK